MERWPNTRRFAFKIRIPRENWNYKLYDQFKKKLKLDESSGRYYESEYFEEETDTDKNESEVMIYINVYRKIENNQKRNRMVIEVVLGLSVVLLGFIGAFIFIIRSLRQQYSGL